MVQHPFPFEPAQPEVLGRYRLLKELGRGTMGRVFLAHDPQIDRSVAIKTIQHFFSLPDSERFEARERFLREARAVGRLGHPGIVTLYDVDEAQGLLYLVMEYVEGDTLESFCRPGNLLPARTVVLLLSHAAETLSHAHRAGIVHRDIKPANLIRVGDASVKIADFGLAKPPEAQLTQHGAVLGTPSYMSPEQIRGGQVDGRSDLFSLGVVLYEMLTGEKPFPGDSISSIIYRIVHEPLRDPAKLPKPLPAALAKFLTRALAKEPGERYATGDAFAAALRQSCEALAAPRAPVLPAPAPPRPAVAKPRRSSAAPFIGGAVVAVALGIGATFLFGERATREPAGSPEPSWEARVRAEPATAELLLDGAPLAASEAGRVRFSAQRAGLLTARQACRTAEHQLSPQDANAEVVLVLDPVDLVWALDPGVEADLMVNGQSLGSTPLSVTLDLCRDNHLQLRAPGYRDHILALPAGLTPLEARSRLGTVALERIPKGTLVLPKAQVDLAYYLDGKRLGRSPREVELTEGEHELQAKNEHHWIDVRRRFQVVGGQRVSPEMEPPAMATLAVQAFPSNCKVYVRAGGGKWRYLDDTPAVRRVPAGRYEVKVERIPTGETRVQGVDLAPGNNPPVRVSFGGR